MQARWFTGVNLGKRPGSEENLVMTETGAVVRARALREVLRPVTMEDLNKLKGAPHDPAGTMRAGGHDEGRGDELQQQGEEESRKRAPNSVMITKEVVTKFGPTENCRKCQGLLDKNKAYQHVHHTPECRQRMTELMRQDERFCRQVEAAEDRQVRRIAEILEERDRLAAARKGREEEPPRGQPEGAARVEGGASGSGEQERMTTAR